MSSIGVVLDACVLFPGSLRDTLLRVNDAGLYRLCLTDEIIEEMRRNLVKKSGVEEEKAQRLVDTIKKQFEDAFTTKHRLLITSMPVNDKDKHVLAAAVASQSQIIVTQNLKDFPQHLLQPFEVEALSPDEFLVNQFYQNKEVIVNLITEQASELRKPPHTHLELLDRLELFVPNFALIAKDELGVKQDYKLLYKLMKQKMKVR
jgi:predicted nucleic acid-binding protein